MKESRKLKRLVELWTGRKGELAWHVLVFVVAVSVAILPAHALAKESVFDQVESDRSIFGEGTITAHDLWFPDSEPGSISYQRVDCTSEWLGDGNYRVLIRASDMEYQWDSDSIPVENIDAALQNESDKYIPLSEDWTIIEDDIPPLEGIKEVYFRIRNPSPMSGGPYMGKWQIRLDAAVDTEEYANERAWKWKNWLPWFLGLFGFSFAVGNWVVRQVFSLRGEEERDSTQRDSTQRM